MNTQFLLMAKYEKPRLSLQELAEFMGISLERAQNMRYKDELPVPTYKEGARVYADIRDVAEYLDAMRNQARDAHRAIQGKR